MFISVAVIEVRGLRKVYSKDKVALKGIDITVDEGTVYSLLGPNGAGKTTTVSILSCVLRPSDGQVRVLGKSVPDDCSEIREYVGVIPQTFVGFGDLTVRENLEYFSRLYGRDTSEVTQILDSLGLKEFADVRYRRLSGGLMRRVGIGCALVGQPKLIFMDEPSIGLDPKARRDLWDIIKGLRTEGKTIFLTTHYMEEAQKLSDKVSILVDGRIVASGRPDEIVTARGSSTLEEAYLSIVGQVNNQGEEEHMV